MTGWVESVAKRAGIEVSNTDRILKKWGIRPDRCAATVPTLCIKRIEFAGFKHGDEAQPFRFKWADLSSGVWALGSYTNFVGKSTVFEVTRWMLRGEPKQPKGLSSEMRKGWLRSAELDFELDQQAYGVRMNVAEGVPSGSLVRLGGDQQEVVDTFASDAGFAVVMARFMMDAFDLEPVTSFKVTGEDGRSDSHGWSALSSALFLGGDHSLLFGDIQFAGLPGRMLQMFVGLPWAQTVMSAGTAQKEISHKAAAARRSNETANAVQAADVERLLRDLKSARKQLADLPEPPGSGEGLEALGRKADVQNRVFRDTQDQVERAETDAARFKTIADEDEQEVRSTRETVVAGRFFNGLSPACCPRCETTITKERKRQESEAMQCAVCSHPISLEQQEQFDEHVAALGERARASRIAAERAAALIGPLRDTAERLRQELASTQQAFDAVVKASSALSERRKIELEIARLEGALSERQRPSTPVEETPDAGVIEAALKEATDRRDAAKNDILAAMNEEILRLGTAFGIRHLERISLDAGARMGLTKGGVETTFTLLAPGERLRLRIATVIALLRVGKKRGIGRHPGVLFVDSPKAEETSDHDLKILLNELKSVALDLPNLQVFIASAEAQAIEATIAPERRRVVAAGEFLW